MKLRSEMTMQEISEASVRRNAKGQAMRLTVSQREAIDRLEEVRDFVVGNGEPEIQARINDAISAIWDHAIDPSEVAA